MEIPILNQCSISHELLQNVHNRKSLKKGKTVLNILDFIFAFGKCLLYRRSRHMYVMLLKVIWEKLKSI